MTAKGSKHNFSIALFCEGDRQEFNYVFEFYYDTIYLFAYNLIRTEAEAKDIATESFIKLWKLHGNFESLTNIKAFLYVTTRNACLDYIRYLQKLRIAQKEILYLLDNEHAIENEMINAEVFGELSRRIEELPHKCREIFKLIYYENLRTAEVAEKAKTSSQNVLNQKARAISLIRAGLVKKLALESAILGILFLLFN